MKHFHGLTERGLDRLKRGQGPVTTMRITALFAACTAIILTGCARESTITFDCAAHLAEGGTMNSINVTMTEGSGFGRDLLSKYTSFALTTDLSVLSENECKMLPHLFAAASEMDEVFWLQAYGDKEALLSSIQDPAIREFAKINYGPWDRIDGNAPFAEGFGPKPLGANLYPVDMSKSEFEAAVLLDPTLADLYTVVVRDSDEKLKSIPYHEAFGKQMESAAAHLKAAAEFADDPGLKNYLTLRADALLSSDYQASDFAWMDMKTNRIEMVIGPIETYEDALFGQKAAAEAYVLIKDMAWSERLSRYAALLPQLQKGLPVPDAYKQEMPGTDSDLNAYDVIFYAGDTNAGSKTIAINLPNDEEVQLSRGTRRLQLKNSMQAKFDKILVPIADQLIAEDQRGNISFDAFFGNTMFHEVAHGLGIKNTITGKGTVREALKEHASALEEGKADILGLYMVLSLIESGDYEAVREDHMVTFMAGIFRSVRFGASSAHGKANMIRFNFFQEMGAFTRDAVSGTYRVDFEKMELAMAALSETILKLQGVGDYSAVGAFVADYGQVGSELQSDLDRLSEAGIPVDIVFEQGLSVVGRGN